MPHGYLRHSALSITALEHVTVKKTAKNYERYVLHIKQNFNDECIYNQHRDYQVIIIILQVIFIRISLTHESDID